LVEGLGLGEMARPFTRPWPGLAGVVALGLGPLDVETFGLALALGLAAGVGLFGFAGVDALGCDVSPGLD
jgi:hypothetical protein